jgi:hypothetical protein
VRRSRSPPSPNACDGTPPTPCTSGRPSWPTRPRPGHARRAQLGRTHHHRAPSPTQPKCRGLGAGVYNTDLDPEWPAAQRIVRFLSELADRWSELHLALVPLANRSAARQVLGSACCPCNVRDGQVIDQHQEACMIVRLEPITVPVSDVGFAKVFLRRRDSLRRRTGRACRRQSSPVRQVDAAQPMCSCMQGHRDE